MGYRLALLPREGLFDPVENLDTLTRDLHALVGREPDRGQMLTLKQRLESIIAEIGGKPRSITPGPGSVNARSLIRAVLRLSAGAWIDVDLDDSRRIIGVRVDGEPITDEQWIALQRVGLIKLAIKPGACSEIDPSRKTS